MSKHVGIRGLMCEESLRDGTSASSAPLMPLWGAHGCIDTVEGKNVAPLILGSLARRPEKHMAKPIGSLSALQGAQRKVVQHCFLQQYLHGTHLTIHHSSNLLCVALLPAAQPERFAMKRVPRLACPETRSFVPNSLF